MKIPKNKNLYRKEDINMLEGNELIAVKANKFVQEYKVKNLNMTEIRIINYLIANIDSPVYDKEFRKFRFDIKEFYQAIYPGKDPGSEYKRLPKTIQKLSDKSAWKEIPNEENPKKNKIALIRWIERPEFEEGYINIELNPYLAPYLLQLDKGFFKSKFQYTALAQSKYTIPLYELLKSWEKIKDHKKRFEVMELREYLDATKKSQDNLAEFKRTVLDTAVREINEITDLKVSYEEIKHGRKTTHIEFTILKKGGFEKVATDIDVKESDEQLDGQRTFDDFDFENDAEKELSVLSALENSQRIVIGNFNQTTTQLSEDEAMERYREALPKHSDDEIKVLVKLAAPHVPREGSLPQALRMQQYFEDHYDYAKANAKAKEGTKGFKSYLLKAIEGNSFKKRNYE